MKECACIYCGSKKQFYNKPCPNCKRVPSSAEDVAKSLILCREFQLDGANLPLDTSEWQELLEKIRRGDQQAFDTRQVEIVAAHQSKYVKNPRAIALGSVAFFGPVLIGLLLLAWYLLKS